MASSPFDWNRSLTSQLLEILPTYPCLWNFKSVDYRDRNKRQAAADEIKSSLGVELSLNDIKNKIETIRKIKFECIFLFLIVRSTTGKFLLA